MSLGLALYLLRSSRRNRAEPEEEQPPRAPGDLVLFHAPDEEAVRAVDQLWPAMRAGRPGLQGVTTGPGHLPPPPDTPNGARAFLDLWAPSLVVLTGGTLPAALITEAERRDIPVYLIDTRSATLVQGGRWYPGLIRALMRRITRVLAADEGRALHYRRLGLPADRVLTVGRVEHSPPALPCTEAEREALARGLRTRMVWLAAAIPEEEEATIIAAHVAALRLSHRLLLIIVPADPARGPAIAAQAEAEGLDVALRSREDYPDDEDQVYVADTEEEFGLWYRLAQICFLGGTLIGEGPLRHPLEPAALGAAILHGPRTQGFGDALERLDAVRAARLVTNGDMLCEAIGDLRAADRVALMAHNAWVVASDGADVTDRVARMLLGVLADRKAG